MTIDQIKAAAIEALTARSAASRIANELPTYEARQAAYKLLPSTSVSFGNVEVCAITPENRTTYRRPHFRFQYRIGGKMVAETEAAAALAA